MVSLSGGVCGCETAFGCWVVYMDVGWCRAVGIYLTRGLDEIRS